MGTHHTGTEEERRALDAYIKLMRAAGAVTVRSHRHLAAVGLTVTQFGVLEALYHLGSLSQRDLGAKLLKSGGNITLVIDNLEKRGLVKREREAHDRRFNRVNLTVEGHGLIQNVMPRHVAGIVDELRHLTPEEQLELGRLCRKLGLKGLERAQAPLLTE